jgi:hypothetical protein
MREQGRGGWRRGKLACHSCRPPWPVPAQPGLRAGSFSCLFVTFVVNPLSRRPSHFLQIQQITQCCLHAGQVGRGQSAEAT